MCQTKYIIDEAMGGSIMTKIYEEAYELKEKLAFNHYLMTYDRTIRKPTTKVLQIDAFNAISPQIAPFSKQKQSLGVHP